MVPCPWGFIYTRCDMCPLFPLLFLSVSSPFLRSPDFCTCVKLPWRFHCCLVALCLWLRFSGRRFHCYPHYISFDLISPLVFHVARILWKALYVEMEALTFPARSHFILKLLTGKFYNGFVQTWFVLLISYVLLFLVGLVGVIGAV